MGYVYNPLLGAGLDNTGPGGDITAVAAGTGLTGGGTNGDVTLSLANTAVNAGSYSYGSFTVDAQGRITAASNGGIGSTTQLLFNDAGSIGGDVDLTWNKTTNLLTIGGDVNLNDGGTYTTTLQTITPTANRTISLPNATGTVALVGGSSGQVVYNNAGAYAGGPLYDATKGTLGYPTGGTVTQATSKSTGVTLNGASGRITLNAAALAADTTVSFTLTNSSITANDLLVLNHVSVGAFGSYLLAAQAAAGSATINVRNITAASLSEAIVIGFAVLKA